MICEACKGTGFVPSKTPHVRPHDPCEECGGTAVAHCCDGIVACPILDGEDGTGENAVTAP